MGSRQGRTRYRLFPSSRQGRTRYRLLKCLSYSGWVLKFYKNIIRIENLHNDLFIGYYMILHRVSFQVKKFHCFLKGFPSRVLLMSKRFSR